MRENSWRKTLTHPAMDHSVEVTWAHEGDSFLRNEKIMRVTTVGADGRDKRLTVWAIGLGACRTLRFLGRYPGVRKCFCGAVLGVQRTGIEDHFRREHA